MDREQKVYQKENFYKKMRRKEGKTSKERSLEVEKVNWIS